MGVRLSPFREGGTSDNFNWQVRYNDESMAFIKEVKRTGIINRCYNEYGPYQFRPTNLGAMTEWAKTRDGTWPQTWLKLIEFLRDESVWLDLD